MLLALVMQRTNVDKGSVLPYWTEREHSVTACTTLSVLRLCLESSNGKVMLMIIYQISNNICHTNVAGLRIYLLFCKENSTEVGVY